MAASTRIKAQNIAFKIGTEDYACDATSVNLELGDAPGDVRTFCEVSVGKQWTLTLEGITSGAADSLYRILWDNYGTEVAFTIAPHGNASPTTSQPHYKGTVIFSELPPLALTAGETATFSVALEVDNSVHTPASDIYWGVEVETA
jgi:hypothetical protein